LHPTNPSRGGTQTMPCDAVATASAQVAQEQLLRLLTPDTVREPIAAFLRARYPQAQVTAGIASWVDARSIGWEVHDARSRVHCTVTLNTATGRVDVTDLGAGSTSGATQALADEIRAALVQLGGVYLQQTVAVLLA